MGKLHTSGIIDRFTGKWFVLSNFHRHPFVWKRQTWKTAEHAFQAAKCVSSSDADAIAKATTPAEAKRLGRLCEMRHDWNDRRVKTMKSILRAKFAVEPMRGVLLSTNNARLVEGNTWGDEFWGVCRGRGKNHLGKLLMKERKRIRKEEKDHA